VEDIPMLLKHFVEMASRDLSIEVPEIPEALIQMLSGYSFPGNIREMESMTFNALSQLSSGQEKLSEVSFVRDIELSSGEKIVFEPVFENNGGEEELCTIDDSVDGLIQRTLHHFNHNQTATAKSLGITRQGLLARLKRRKLDT
jgi:DNA-binding NtrC family response regulator